MNGMTCSDLCMLFCCPPWPSRIAAKLAFLPPEPTYSIMESDSSSSANGAGDTEPLGRSKSNNSGILVINEPLSFNNLSEGDKEKQEVFMSESRRGNRIACLYIHTNRNTKTTVLLSHGNAVDLGQMTAFMTELSSKLNVNIMSYDYSGYGMSTGKPSEKNLYADIECALEQLRTRFNVPLEQIVLYGQSIGTAPTADLATRYTTGLVILHSPLLSGLRVAFPATKFSFCCDAFPNIDKVARIDSPTLVIHGTEDDVIDYCHGQEIYERLSNPLDPLFIVGAGHNDCEMFPQYLERLRQLISEDLKNLKYLLQHQLQHQQTNNSSPSTAGER